MGYGDNGEKSMKRIKLTQGKYALVDDEDFEKLNKHKWYFHQGYVHRNSKTFFGKRKVISLHRAIMNYPKNKQIDHIDGNGLNCQKYNMRICTNNQNGKNQKKPKIILLGIKEYLLLMENILGRK
jgi:hypothetical protein